MYTWLQTNPHERMLAIGGTLVVGLLLARRR